LTTSSSSHDYAASKAFFLGLNRSARVAAAEWLPNGADLSAQRARLHCACTKPGEAGIFTLRSADNRQQAEAFARGSGGGRGTMVAGLPPALPRKLHAAFVIGPTATTSGGCHEPEA
jgi:hypothetical protein